MACDVGRGPSADAAGKRDALGRKGAEGEKDAAGEKDVRPTLAARRARLVAWFFGDSWSAALAWAAVAVACVGVLAWFFLVSPFGVPAQPVYAGF